MKKYLKVAEVKRTVKENKRRSSKDFVEELNKVVACIVEGCCARESKKKTLYAVDVKEVVIALTCKEK